MIRNWRRGPRKAYWRVRAFYRDCPTLDFVDMIMNQMMMLDKTGDNEFRRWRERRNEVDA